jgi:cytochrome bd-type quinol oxidase subunit 1
MKKTVVVTILILLAALMFSVQGYAKDKDDMQAIKKAVKENPEFEAGKPAQWFKVLVTDSKTGKEKVKITLPLSLADILAKYAQQHEKGCLKLDREGMNINLAEIFAELKKLGPMMFIEVTEENETVKIWLE